MIKEKPILAFVHIPKTAGTTFLYILRNSFGLGHCDLGRYKNVYYIHPPHLRLARKVFPCLVSIAGHNIIEPTAYNMENIMPYTFLRNPLERCASYYNDNVRRAGEKRPFEEWILDEDKQDMQVRMIAGEPSLNKAKKLLSDSYFFTGIFERLRESLNVFSLLSPYPVKLEYKSQNVFEDNSIKKELLANKKSLDLLKKYNRLDLELYEFAAEKLFPLLLKKSGLDKSNLKEMKEVSFRPRVALCNGYNKHIFRQITKIVKV